jgi:hypothetical protein
VRAISDNKPTLLAGRCLQMTNIGYIAGNQKAIRFTIKHNQVINTMVVITGCGAFE